MRCTYFNVYMLPLGYSGIVINFLVNGICKCPLFSCFQLGLSVCNWVHFGIIALNEDLCFLGGKEAKIRRELTCLAQLYLCYLFIFTVFLFWSLIKSQVWAYSCLLSKDRNWITLRRLHIFVWKTLLFLDEKRTMRVFLTLSNIS